MNQTQKKAWLDGPATSFLKNTIYFLSFIYIFSIIYIDLFKVAHHFLPLLISCWFQIAQIFAFCKEASNLKDVLRIEKGVRKGKRKCAVLRAHVGEIACFALCVCVCVVRSRAVSNERAVY